MTKPISEIRKGDRVLLHGVEAAAAADAEAIITETIWWRFPVVNGTPVNYVAGPGCAAIEVAESKVEWPEELEDNGSY